MTFARRITFSFWLVVTVSLAILYLSKPELINPGQFVNFLRELGSLVLVGYFLLSVLRPMILVPSTVLIVVGTLLFPGDPFLVFMVSLAAIVVSAALIYYFFDFLGIDQLFEHKHQTRLRWLEKQLTLKGFWIVVGWSMFPFVPTDAICYVAGTFRMHIGKFLLGVMLGEIPIVAFYVMGGTWFFGS